MKVPAGSDWIVKSRSEAVRILGLLKVAALAFAGEVKGD